MSPLQPWLRFVVPLVLLAPAAPVEAFPANLRPIADALEKRGWKVLLKQPPRKGIYGLANSKKKTIWVHPITEEMGIMSQTFVHEAVHAVQSCPDGVLSPIGWNAQVAPVVEREISAILLKKYRASTRVLEREAFFIQGQRNGPMLILNELKKRC